MTAPISVPVRRLPGHLWAAARLAAGAAPAVLVTYGVLAVVAGMLPVLAASLLSRTIDALTSGRPVLPTVSGLVVVGMFTGVLPGARSYLNGRLIRAVGLKAMDRLYAAMDRITGLAVMETPAFRDRLQMAQQSGRSGPGQLVDDGLSAVEALVSLTAFLGALIALNPLLALLAFAAAVPAVIAQARLNRRRAGMLWRISSRARREMHYAELLTSLSAAKELRMLGLGGLFRRRMRTEMSAINDEHTAQEGRELRVRSVLTAVTAAVAGVGLLWAVNEASRGRLSIGDITLLVAALAGVQSALGGLVDRFTSAHENALLFDHYRALVLARADLPLKSGAAAPLRTGLVVEDVWFRYGPDKPWVLRGVNMTIPHGTAVAVVGLNGAGKSTLIKLLCRFYDPTRGRITWDGVDIRDIEVAALRDRIGAVFQDYMTYDLSAAENIGIGDVANLDDRDAVQEAARRAGVHEVITALPSGYDTMLTNAWYDEADKEDPTTGVLLSGGQWQRVALARAFRRDDRDLLILDEPTAGLDPEAEYELHHRLKRHRSGRTSVLVSHRLNTIRDADRIVVLAEGVVVEEGSHADLLDIDGGYARLFRMQADGYQPVAAS